MILINPKLDCKIEKCICGRSGRYIILDISVDDSHLILANIYAPNDLSQQSNFFKTLHGQQPDFSQKNVIIGGGSVNCALSDKDKKGGNAGIIKEIEELCTSYNLVDIWRRLNPLLESYTWRNVNKMKGTDYEARQTSKEETKMPIFILECPRPCTIFSFALIRCA